MSCDHNFSRVKVSWSQCLKYVMAFQVGRLLICWLYPVNILCHIALICQRGCRLSLIPLPNMPCTLEGDWHHDSMKLHCNNPFLPVALFKISYSIAWQIQVRVLWTIDSHICSIDKAQIRVQQIVHRVWSSQIPTLICSFDTKEALLKAIKSETRKRGKSCSPQLLCQN